ncbi:hypothetical protein HK102_011231 [Quaeritorhiza haematococci]|nr:hypothetical protein HK102_011231 [Quaeritorhiza haematococci]
MEPRTSTPNGGGGGGGNNKKDKGKRPREDGFQNAKARKRAKQVIDVQTAPEGSASAAAPRTIDVVEYAEVSFPQDQAVDYTSPSPSSSNCEIEYVELINILRYAPSVQARAFEINALEKALRNST